MTTAAEWAPLIRDTIAAHNTVNYDLDPGGRIGSRVMPDRSADRIADSQLLSRPGN